MSPSPILTCGEPQYTLTTIVNEGELEVKNVGISNYPNWKLKQARSHIHHLNLLLIGVPGVGKGTLVNTLFDAEILSPQRVREGAGESQFATYYGRRIEGGVELDINVTELLGFTSSACLTEEGYSSKLVEFVRKRHWECYSKENAPSRNKEKLFDGLFHAVLYFIPPTFAHFSKVEIELFRELQKMTLVIPIISKADMYTRSELKDKKLLIRAQFEANSLSMIPNLMQGLTDDWMVEDLGRILEHWPLALICSTELHGEGSHQIRARIYPWGVIDVDNEEFSDLHYLERLLIASFFILTREYVRHELYEMLWRPSFLLSRKVSLSLLGQAQSKEFKDGRNSSKIDTYRPESIRLSHQSRPELIASESSTIQTPKVLEEPSISLASPISVQAMPISISASSLNKKSINMSSASTISSISSHENVPEETLKLPREPPGQLSFKATRSYFESRTSSLSAN